MRVTTLGSGNPRVVVVGAVHGDEPCGARAIEQFISEDHDIQRPVKLIILNEPALAENVRYIDTDVNRVLPGDPTSDLYEERLAYDFVQEVTGCVGIGIHSTYSSSKPFATIANPNPRKRELFASLSRINHMVDFTAVSSGSRCVDLPWFVDFEAGLQQSEDAVDNAYSCIIDFLRFTGVLDDDDVNHTGVREYKVYEIFSKEGISDYHFCAENFKQIEKGEVYATQSGRDIIADQSFYPILFSDDGHEEIFGYKATLQD
jgi:succinylglutamate desuccinylase